MKKRFQGLAAILAITLLGWSVYYVSVPSPQEESAASLTPSTPALTGNTAKSEENLLPSIAASRQPTANYNTAAPTGEMHLEQTHNLDGKIPVPASEPVDLASQNISIKKEENKPREILPGVTIKGGGVNVSLDKDDSRTLEVRPRSQTQLTLKQKF